MTDNKTYSNDFYGDQEIEAKTTNLKMKHDIKSDVNDSFDILANLYDERSIKEVTKETEKVEMVVSESDRLKEEARQKKIVQRQKKKEKEKEKEKEKSKLSQIKLTFKKKQHIYDDPFDAPLDQSQAIADRYDDWI